MNTTMPCLSKRYEEIKSHIPGMEQGRAAHVTGLFCPTLAMGGIARIHPSNGSYVVVDDGERDVLYARCTDCDSNGVDLKDSLVEVVGGTQSLRFPWARYDAKAYERLSERWKAGPEALQTPRRKRGTPDS